jgi:hypothetical protein
LNELTKMNRELVRRTINVYEIIEFENKGFFTHKQKTENYFFHLNTCIEIIC